MKKILAIVLVLSMLLTGFAFAETVKIGVYEPASGANGGGGKQEMLGMQYANEITPTIEIGGVTYDIELVYADNQSDPAKAPSAATSLVDAGVSVVLGSYGSSVAIAGGPIFKEAGVPAIGVTCTNPAVTDTNDHYFRICFLDPFQGTVLANYAKEQLGADVVYCLGELGNDYDQGLINYFTAAAEALGIQVFSESFTTGTVDFTSFLSTADALEADVVFAPCSLEYAGQMIPQAAGLGASYIFMGPDTWDSNIVIDAAKDAGLQIYCSTFYAEGGVPEFDAGFKAWLNANPDMLTNNNGNDIISAVSVMGYDAYYVALEAMKLAGSVEPADIWAALPELDYTGVSGRIVFNEIGDANRTTAFVKGLNNETGLWDNVVEQTVAE